MTLSNDTELPTYTAVVRGGTPDDARDSWRCFETHLNWINVSYDLDDIILRRQSFAYTQQVFVTYPSAVLEIDGVIYGYAVTERRDLGILEIVNLYVNESYQGKGFGTQMLREIERQAPSHGFHTVMGFSSDRYYPDKKLPTTFFERNDYEVRSLSHSTEMYLKPMILDVDEKYSSISDTKRVIFRSIMRTERSGRGDVMIYSDLEVIHNE